MTKPPTLDLDASPQGTKISLEDSDCPCCPPYLYLRDAKNQTGVVVSLLDWDELEEWLADVRRWCYREGHLT